MEKGLLSLETFETARNYWLERLQGEWEENRFFPRYGTAPSYLEKSERIALSAPLTERLIAMGKGKDLSLYVLLLTGFNLFLSKLLNKEEVTVASPVFIAGGGTEAPLTGNAFVLFRNAMEDGTSYKQLLALVQQTVVEGYKNQHYPFSKLAGDLQVEPDKLFGHFLFAMDAIHSAEVYRSLKQEYSPDCSFLIERTGDILGIRCDYNSNRLQAHVVRQLLACFVTVMEQAVEDVTVSRAGLRLFREQAALAWMNELNETQQPYARHELIHQSFEEQARLQPDGIAVVGGAASLTYRQLNEEANRLAALLQKRGIQQGLDVAVIMDRTPDMIVAVLAVLKAGGAYVPLEPNTPKARIETILNGLDVRVLLTKHTIAVPFQELLWKVPSLQDIVYMDVNEKVPGPEWINHSEVEALWDHVAESATDEVTVGGFRSSYTGESFSEKDVNQYVQYVTDLVKPHVNESSKVLEIGCGPGHILSELAPLIHKGVGMDPSSGMIGHNIRRSAELGVSNLEWVKGYAHEVSDLLTETYDAIIMASTVQFFPGYFYLEDVIRSAMSLLKPGGAFIVADIMDIGRKDAFIASIEQFKQAHPESARSKSNFDGELYCDARLFQQLNNRLEAIGSVEIIRRDGLFDNELQYRFDVVIRKTDSSNAGMNAAAGEGAGSLQYWTRHHISSYSGDNVAARTDAGTKAYTIFTSGSTGVPKGVVVTHRPVINLMQWVNGTFGVCSTDRLLFLTSLCFDLSVYDIFGTLSAGGSIRIASEEEVRNPERLLAIVANEGITFWDSAPAALQQLAILMEQGNVDCSTSALRLVFLSGDWIPLTLPDTLKRNFPGVQVIGLGGATEAAVWSNFFPIGQVDPDWASIPYGRPIANARYYILNESLEPCPYHVNGDLYIGGECLASGYTDPVITKERFIPDPFGLEPGAVMYKTGDLARWMADGNMEFMGRSDHQVKIRGYRVELGEIQAQLIKHPLVKEAIVIDRAREDGEKTLCAYIVAESQCAVSVWRDYLAQTLPAYMIPGHFVHLDRMPVTSNGKLDRKALPAPGDSVITDTEYEAPRNEIEAIVCDVWTKILNIERVGIKDHFFDLGGSSMQIIQVNTALSQRGLKVSVQDLFVYLTIDSLSPHLSFSNRSEEDVEDETGEIPIHPNIAYSLSFPNNPDLNLWGDKLLFQFPIQLNPEWVHNAVKLMIERHDALRGRFIKTEQGWIERIVPFDGEVPFKRIDMTVIPEEEQFDYKLKRFRELEEETNLEHGPLFGLRLFDYGAGKPSELCYFIHHYCMDKYSLDILRSEMIISLQAQMEGKEIVLPPRTSSYAKFARAMMHYAESEACEKQLDYWLEITKYDHNIPVDNPDGECISWSFKPLKMKYPIKGTLGILKKALKQDGIQLNDIMVAAYLSSYSRWSGKDHLLMNIFDTGRYPYSSELELANTMGWMNSMFPVQYRYQSDANTFDFLMDIRRQNRLIPKDNSYGLLKYCHPSQEIREKMMQIPDPQVNFNFKGIQSIDEETVQLDGITTVDFPLRDASGDMVRSNWILISCGVENEDIVIDWEYSTELHHPSTIESWNKNFLLEIELITLMLQQRYEGIEG
ncbi:AMP-binding protein [Paenibacillus oenotherae]|uniref:AMP-binding protein n=1 Tax=Paenibacillus oenotherae TaxID=1435645 RepID=A0ABS7DC94_9BACL|nr:AMP-binding protein [Paenibacillus oenotherae]MBW7477117.1 AMP-binding protein [Paenibacillus oenotherae]